MIDRAEMATILGIFALPLQMPLNVETIRAWQAVLGDADPQALRVAAAALAREWRKDRGMFPAPGDLLARVPGASGPSENEDLQTAWTLVLQSAENPAARSYPQQAPAYANGSDLPQPIFDAIGGLAGMRAVFAALGDPDALSSCYYRFRDALRARREAVRAGRCLPSFRRPAMLGEPGTRGNLEPHEPETEEEFGAGSRSGDAEAFKRLMATLRSPTCGPLDIGHRDEAPSVDDQKQALARWCVGKRGDGGGDAR